MHPVRKWGNVLISGGKPSLGQTDALCWKSLRSGPPNAKMLKRADLRLKTLFWTNSCPLLKTLRSGVPSVKMTKHADLGLKTLFCTNSCSLLKKKMKSVASSAKMLKRADLGLKTLFWTNSCTLLKRVKKWCTQCKNESTCWSKANNAVLDKLVHFAENRLKVVRPVRKWGNVLISGRKHCYEQTRALCWNSLISSVHSAG